MKLIFDDGSAQDCLPTSERQIATGDVLVSPQSIPKHLRLVWTTPKTYAQLVFVSCENIQPGHYVMTSEGLKRVAALER